MPCSSQSCAQRLHELRRHDVEAAFALDRLDDDGGHLLGLDVGLEELVRSPSATSSTVTPCSAIGHGTW